MAPSRSTGRVEVVKRLLLNLRGDLSSESTELNRFVDHERAVGLLNGGDGRADVHWVQRSEIDNFYFDALLSEPLGGLEGEHHLTGIRNYGRVRTHSLDIGHSKRHDIIAFGNVSAACVESLVLEEYHDVVVANRRLSRPFAS